MIPTRPERKRLWWWALFAVPVLLASVLVITQHQSGEILARAQRQLAAQELEAAVKTLQPLHRQPLLSSSDRRRGAGLLLRLGEDRKAHTLLLWQQYSEEDPADHELRELSARSQRAAAALGRAERSTEPEERVRLMRDALEELPEAPRLLQRVVQEELMAMAQTGNEEFRRAFARDYERLRRSAPTLADEVKRRAQAEMAEETR